MVILLSTKYPTAKLILTLLGVLLTNLVLGTSFSEVAWFSSKPCPDGDNNCSFYPSLAKIAGLAIEHNNVWVSSNQNTHSFVYSFDFQPNTEQFASGQRLASRESDCQGVPLCYAGVPSKITDMVFTNQEGQKSTRELWISGRLPALARWKWEASTQRYILFQVFHTDCNNKLLIEHISNLDVCTSLPTVNGEDYTLNAVTIAPNQESVWVAGDTFIIQLERLSSDQYHPNQLFVNGICADNQALNCQYASGLFAIDTNGVDDDVLSPENYYLNTGNNRIWGGVDVHKGNSKNLWEFVFNSSTDSYQLSQHIAYGQCSLNDQLCRSIFSDSGKSAISVEQNNYSQAWYLGGSTLWSSNINGYDALFSSTSRCSSDNANCQEISGLSGERYFLMISESVRNNEYNDGTRNWVVGADKDSVHVFEITVPPPPPPVVGMPDGLISSLNLNLSLYAGHWDHVNSTVRMMYGSFIRHDNNIVTLDGITSSERCSRVITSPGVRDTQHYIFLACINPSLTTSGTSTTFDLYQFSSGNADFNTRSLVRSLEVGLSFNDFQVTDFIVSNDIIYIAFLTSFTISGSRRPVFSSYNLISGNVIVHKEFSGTLAEELGVLTILNNNLFLGGRDYAYSLSSNGPSLKRFNSDSFLENEFEFPKMAEVRLGRIAAVDVSSKVYAAGYDQADAFIQSYTLQGGYDENFRTGIERRSFNSVNLMAIKAGDNHVDVAAAQDKTREIKWWRYTDTAEIVNSFGTCGELTLESSIISLQKMYFFKGSDDVLRLYLLGSSDTMPMIEVFDEPALIETPEACPPQPLLPNLPCFADIRGTYHHSGTACHTRRCKEGITCTEGGCSDTFHCITYLCSSQSRPTCDSYFLKDACEACRANSCGECQ